jgi:hypothetical protein
MEYSIGYTRGMVWDMLGVYGMGYARDMVWGILRVWGIYTYAKGMVYAYV